MKYEIDYMQYHFLINSDLPNSRETMKVLYKGCLIIDITCLQLFCITGYNNESIREREERMLDKIFRSYEGNILNLIPKVIEVLCGKYMSEFLRFKSIII